MTNTRIDHTGHNHPSTTAARTACRKALGHLAGAVFAPMDIHCALCHAEKGSPCVNRKSGAKVATHILRKTNADELTANNGVPRYAGQDA